MYENLKIDELDFELDDLINFNPDQPPSERMQSPPPMLPNDFYLGGGFFEGSSSIPPTPNGGYGPDPRFQASMSFNYGSKSETSELPPIHYHSDVERNKYKKKAADQKYRNKQKEGRQKLIENLGKFEDENNRLTVENGIVKRERDEMNTGLQIANIKAKELKTEVCKLKETIKVQDTIVTTFSHQVINGDRGEEVAKLKRKFDVMKEKIEWEDWMTEKEELLKKIATLEHQNKLAKVQIEALCLKISNPTGIDSEEG